MDPWATGEAVAFGGAPPHQHPATPAHGSTPYPGSPYPSSPAGPHHTRPYPDGSSGSHPGTLPYPHAPAGPPHGAPWLASAEAAAQQAAGAPSRAYRKPVLWVVAAIAAIAVGTAATLTVVFWPRTQALDYRPLSASQAIHIPPALSVKSGFMATATIGDRFYFASVNEQGLLGVVAADAGNERESWSSTLAGIGPRWDSIVALPGALAVFTEVDYDSRSRRMAILGADRGELLWQRTIGRDDEVRFVADVAVLADRENKRLLLLEINGKGRVRAEVPDPPTDSSIAPRLVPVTTHADVSGPAGMNGVAASPDRSDDPRLVQITGDRSARVLNGRTGKIEVPIRPHVAGYDDEIVAHEGRLIVRESVQGHRLFVHDLKTLTEPRLLYTAPDDRTRITRLTSCGDEQVCWIETTDHRLETTHVMGINAATGEDRWRRAVAKAENLVPVGESVLVAQNSSPAEVSLLNPDGSLAWARTGAAARLNSANILLFSKEPSVASDDPSLSGHHLGDEVVELGVLRDVRTRTCSWNTSTLACVGDEDLVLQRFTA